MERAKNSTRCFSHGVGAYERALQKFSVSVDISVMLLYYVDVHYIKAQMTWEQRELCCEAVGIGYDDR
jgi:hypothetical protein